MNTKYAIRNVDMGQGERMPLLVDVSTGLGVFEPTAWSLSLRSKQLQVNTISDALSAVSFLYETLAHSSVNLMARVHANDLLSLNEVEGLVARAKYDKTELLRHEHRAVASNVLPHPKKLSKSEVARSKVAPVKSNTAAKRLYYISKYLEWLADYAFLTRIPSRPNEFRGVATLVVNAIRARTPKKSQSKKKLGLSDSAEQRLLAVTSPTSPENPWVNSFIRQRNWLIIRMLRDLGIRKGELLGVKIQDINFSDNTISIKRRPDDPEDPRIRKALTKTLERTLPLGDALVEVLRAYMDEYRAAITLARVHPFLIVSQTGEPSALNSIDWIFKTLQERFPELCSVSAHILRHTWNDAFSEFAKGKMSPEIERKTRNYLMGWAKDSKMAAVYTARYMEEEGRNASLMMQNAIYGNSGK